jgi:hypothetical protein
MANEIKASVSLNVKTALGAKIDRSASKAIDMAGESILQMTQLLAASNETIDMTNAELGTPGYVFIRNMDPTNYCSIGLTSSYTIKLKPGEFCLFRAAADLYGAFNTAAGYIEVIVFED